MNETASTSSLGFAAFVVMQGFKITSASKGDKKFKIDFAMEANKMTELYQEYVISQFHNFDAIVQTIRRSLRDENSNVLPGRVDHLECSPL